MNSIFPFLDIIILGLLAIFLGFRLKSLLGDRSGYGEDLNTSETYKETDLTDKSNVVSINDQKVNGKGLKSLVKADKNFSEKDFIRGAENAFKIIIKAFADSDTEKLKPLIDYELLKSFTKSISERESRQEKNFLDIISVLKIEILDVVVEDSIASITLKIESEQIKYTLDKDNKILDGNKDSSEKIKDKWVFERDLSSNNPNWKLVETDVLYD